MSRYIDVDLLKDKTTRVNNIWNGTTNAEGKGLDEIIDDIPTADVRGNVRAVWIERELQGLMGRRHTETRCGNCGYEVYRKTPFCPNCGADMRGEA